MRYTSEFTLPTGSSFSAGTAAATDAATDVSGGNPVPLRWGQNFGYPRRWGPAARLLRRYGPLPEGVYLCKACLAHCQRQLDEVLDASRDANEGDSSDSSSDSDSDGDDEDDDDDSDLWASPISASQVSANPASESASACCDADSTNEDRVEADVESESESEGEEESLDYNDIDNIDETDDVEHIEDIDDNNVDEDDDYDDGNEDVDIDEDSDYEDDNEDADIEDAEDHDDSNEDFDIDDAEEHDDEHVSANNVDDVDDSDNEDLPANNFDHGYVPIEDVIGYGDTPAEKYRAIRIFLASLSGEDLGIGPGYEDEEVRRSVDRILGGRSQEALRRAYWRGLLGPLPVDTYARLVIPPYYQSEPERWMRTALAARVRVSPQPYVPLLAPQPRSTVSEEVLVANDWISARLGANFEFLMNHAPLPHQMVLPRHPWLGNMLSPNASTVDLTPLPQQASSEATTESTAEVEDEDESNYGSSEASDEDGDSDDSDDETLFGDDDYDDDDNVDGDYIETVQDDDDDYYEEENDTAMWGSESGSTLPGTPSESGFVDDETLLGTVETAWPPWLSQATLVHEREVNDVDEAGSDSGDETCVDQW